MDFEPMVVDNQFAEVIRVMPEVQFRQRLDAVQHAGPAGKDFGREGGRASPMRDQNKKRQIFLCQRLHKKEVS